MVVDKPLLLKKEAKSADTYTLREKALQDTWLTQCQKDPCVPHITY